MRMYLWTMLGLLVFGIVMRTLWLGLNVTPARTRGSLAIDLLEGVALAAWTGYLLATGAGHG
ncbi:hypothetical protein [Ottowia testudinis]|uniref:Uncharacterized protein n=1 Tax=Ottowia testudinis TaxID=2816950 RepID=A0A975H273_9BURK|nr:hypothetical protein [Ottowia testudinis]QTD44568.1 hypothetical protein J1M35_15930 [Ottowia testudinis]